MNLSNRALPRLAAVPVALTLLLAGSGTALAARPESGEPVTVQGVVTDATGEPLGDVRIVLEAARAYFSLSHFGRREKDLRRLSTTSNERGEFSLSWPWDGYFNRFRLGVAVKLRRPDGEKLHFLERVDITRKMRRGGPVVSALVVEDTSFLDSLRAFLSRLDTEDEHRIYREMGYPDEVKVIEYSNRTEASWWYFAQGEVYRFEEGRLREVGDFEPVTRFEP